MQEARAIWLGLSLSLSRGLAPRKRGEVVRPAYAGGAYTKPGLCRRRSLYFRTGVTVIMASFVSIAFDEKQSDRMAAMTQALKEAKTPSDTDSVGQDLLAKIESATSNAMPKRK